MIVCLEPIFKPKISISIITPKMLLHGSTMRLLMRKIEAYNI